MKNIIKVYYRFSSPQALFKSRKLFYQSTSPLLNNNSFISEQKNKFAEPVSVYCGYDPTAESLHLGNLVSIIMMARLQFELGMRPIFVLGGATGLVGDPSGKIEQRQFIEEEKLKKNLVGIKGDIQGVFENLKKDLIKNYEDYELSIQHQKIKSLFVNNHDFYQNMNILQFLRKVGKSFRMSALLNKQIIANRLQSDSGISYTEFSYSLIQAYDFYTLKQNFGCVLQFGGSDQWGNITNGCDLVKKMSSGKDEVYGITMPLLLTKNGQKFGKSEGNALFLNNQKTPLSSIYEYLFNSSDDEVKTLLYIFTFYSQKKIEQIMKKHEQNPELRIAQRTLAEKVVSYLGKYENVKEQFYKLSPSEVQQKDQSYFQQLYNEISLDMKKEVSRNATNSLNFPQFLVSNGMIESRKEARRNLAAKGFYINNRQIGEECTEKQMKQIYEQYARFSKYIVIRKGKKKYYFIKIHD